MFNKKRMSVSFLSTVLFVSGATMIASAETLENEKERYLIGFQSQQVLESYLDSSQSMSTSVSDELFNFSVEHTYKEIEAVSANLTMEEAARLEEAHGVAYVEKDEVMTISSQTVPDNIEQVKAPVAHQRGLTGAGVKVAVLDTGIAPHPDLHIAGGVSFVSGEDYEDENGHGTHVAGTIAALDNGIGVVGVAPEADLYAVNVLGKEGAALTSVVIEGIEWAIENDMDVVNLSLGGGAPSQALEETVDAAREKGILVVAASGNAGTSSIDYPARYESVIAVGSVDSDNKRDATSQYGDGLSLVAPGVDVLSTFLDGEYVEASGTSMATPAVAGAAALLKEQYPHWTANEIEQRLLSETTAIGPTFEYGQGLLNLDLATK
ncbi:S8 family serine peptidase [Bacillus sp. FSL W7-1360]